MSEEKKTYYERNREKCLAQAREYQKAHAQDYKDYWKVYYQENKDKLREQRREYRRLHPRPKKERPARKRKPTGNPIGRPRKPESEKKLRIPKLKEVKIEPPSPPPEPEEPPLFIDNRPVVVSFD